MSISFVQGANSPLISAVDTTVSFGSNTTGGSLLVVYAITNGGFLTIADTLLNTWTNLYTDSTDSNAGVWYAINKAGGGADTITINQTSISQIEIVALEFTGQNIVPFDDNINGQTGAGTSVSIGPLSTNFSNEILLCLWANATDSDGHVPGAGWTACYTDQASTYLAAMYQSQATKGAYTALGTTAIGGYGAGGLIAIKGTDSSGGGGAGSLLLVGVGH